MIENSRVLVTGASGFTGKYLCDSLRAAGAQVSELSSKHSASSDSMQCDITDKARLVEVVRELNPDYVVHLAAISFVAATNIDLFHEVNVIGTRNLLEALSGCASEKVIIASSANIYGDVSSGKPITEEQEPAPANHYGASKLDMEQVAEDYFEELPIIVTRPFNYTGPGQDEKFLIPKIVAHYKRKEDSIELGNTDVSRDYSFVGDVVDAYIRLLQSEVDSLMVNICSGEAYSVDQILCYLEQQTGRKINVRKNPELVRANEIKMLLGDNSLLKKLTGWSPQHGLEEVLSSMLNT